MLNMRVAVDLNRKRVMILVSSEVNLLHRQAHPSGLHHGAKLVTKKEKVNK